MSLAHAHVAFLANLDPGNYIGNFDKNVLEPKGDKTEGWNYGL